MICLNDYLSDLILFMTNCQFFYIFDKLSPYDHSIPNFGNTFELYQGLERISLLILIKGVKNPFFD